MLDGMIRSDLPMKVKSLIFHSSCVIHMTTSADCRHITGCRNISSNSACSRRIVDLLSNLSGSRGAGNPSCGLRQVQAERRNFELTVSQGEKHPLDGQDRSIFCCQDLWCMIKANAEDLHSILKLDGPVRSSWYAKSPKYRDYATQ